MSRLQFKHIYYLILFFVLLTWFIQPPPRQQPKPSNTPAWGEVITDPKTIGLELKGLNRSDTCNLESINNQPLGDSAYHLNAGAPIKLKGWAMDHRNQLLAKEILLQIAGANGKFFSLAKSGLARQDVVDHFGLPASLINSGFELLINTESIPIGEYSIDIVMSFENSTYLCSNGRLIRFQ